MNPLKATEFRRVGKSRIYKSKRKAKIFAKKMRRIEPYQNSKNEWVVLA